MTLVRNHLFILPSCHLVNIYKESEKEMPDLIRQTIDLQTKMEDVYQWTEDPAAGELVVPAKEVGDVARDGQGRVTSYKTKGGEFVCTLHDYPRYWIGQYLWRSWRANCEVRLESYGEQWTRLTVEIDLQPESFMARVRSSMTRGKYNRYLKERLTAAAQKFHPA